MSNLLRPVSSDDVVVLASAVTVMANPPATMGLVPGSWNPGGSSPQGHVPEFDLSLWAKGTNNLTLATLLAGILHDFTYADNDITSFDASANTATKATHLLLTGDGPFYLEKTAVLPTGLAVLTPYWIIKTSANAVQFATSFANAIAGTAIDFGSGASGQSRIVDIPGTTKRMYLHVMGLIGNQLDGAVALTLQQAYTIRCKHHPRAVAYGVSATLSSSNASDAVSADVVAVTERN